MTPEYQNPQFANNLLPEDLAAFARFGIPPELLAEAQVPRVTDTQARVDYGMRFDAGADLSGIVFLYFSPVTGYRTTARLRRDNPEVIDGKPRNKYIKSWGDSNHLYFPPKAKEKLDNPKTPIVLVESEKAVLALTAWSRRTGVDVIPLGMGGCYGWRDSKASSDEAPNGAWVKIPGPSSDLVHCHNRRVCILLDNNKHDNPDVQKAEAALAREMSKPNRGCTVLVADLPVVDGVNGPDDFIAVCGDEPMRQVFDAAHPAAPFSDNMQAAVQDPRPKVRLPGDNLLLSETAADLGQHFADELLFLRNGEIVTLEENELRTVSAQTFRTLVERYVICYRKRKAGDNTFSVGVTMTENEARGIMASPQFIECLRRVRRLNVSRLPVFRDDGKVELLPEGYHAATETLTVSTADYADNVSLDTAVETIDDLLSEFSFADDESSKGRSKSVAVASLVGLFSAQLTPEGSLRPCFITTKNAEGAGASTLVACAVVPIFGEVPIGTAPEDEAEMKKLITTAVREGKRVLILDNVKGRLSSASLEAFISSSTHSDRLLGGNQSITGPNLVTVFVTANGCTFDPDMRRRSLFSELHLAEERAEDREFRRPLDVPALLALRPKILGACWALVRNWEAKGLPLPDRSHSAFPDWARIVGGIVQAAGYACPLNTAAAAVAADEDGDAMRTLVAAMTQDILYTFSEIVALCQANECFAGLVGNEDTVLDKSGRATLARILSRYDHRLAKNYRFIIEDKGRKRRYRVEKIAPTPPAADGDAPGNSGEEKEKNRPACHADMLNMLFQSGLERNNVYAYGPKEHDTACQHDKSFENDTSEPPEAHGGGKNGSLKSAVAEETPADGKEWL